MLVNGPLGLDLLDIKVIHCNIPKDGISLLELFRSINSNLSQFSNIIFRYGGIICGEGHPIG